MFSRRSRPDRFPRMGTLLSQEGGGMLAGSALVLCTGRAVVGLGCTVCGAAVGASAAGGEALAAEAGSGLGSTAALSSGAAALLAARLLARAESGTSSTTRFG